MTRYRGKDETDLQLECWAWQWVQLFVKNPERASDYIGALGCTLGRVMERHDGASSTTTRDRRFPEGFLGEALVVAVALKYMDLAHREIIGAHYVARVYDLDTGERLRRTIKVRFIAERLGLSVAEYMNRRDVAKAGVRAAFVLEPKELSLARSLVAQSAHVE